MGFFSAIKRMMRNEIAADVSQNNGFDKLVEWWGIDQAKPKAINETTYFTCLKVLSETMGKMPLKFYQEDESGGRVRAPTNNAADMLMYRPNPDHVSGNLLVNAGGKLRTLRQCLRMDSDNVCKKRAVWR